MEYTLENYNIQIAEVNKSAEARKREIAIEFANANNPHRRGDIIEDHIGKFKITNIRLYRGWNNALPCCQYEGIELKKDGTPMKRQSGRFVYQHNIINNETKQI